MRGDGIPISEIINRGKREGVITQGLIAWWLNKGGTTPYLIFKQIKELCDLGILDDDDYECRAYKDKVVFRRVGVRYITPRKVVSATVTGSNGTESEDGEDIDNVFNAAPSENESRSSVSWGDGGA